jgi:hypothetical protein
VTVGAGNVDLVLDPGSTIVGQAVDDRGEALQRFHVVVTDQLEEGEEGLRSFARHPFSISSAGGGFEIRGLGKGPAYLQVHADGHVASEPNRSNFPSVSPPIRFTCPRGVRVGGIVVDATGAPVAGALVRASAPSDDGLAFFGGLEADGIRRRLDRDPSSREYDLKFEPSVAQSGPDGRFELSGVRPGTTVLRAVARGQAPCPPRTLELDPGTTTADLRLALRRGATVRGVVRDPEGKPLEGVDVGVIVDEDSEWHTTGADGTFRFDHVAPAEIVLAAREDPDSGRAPRLRPEVIERVFTPSEGEVVEVELGGPPATRVRVTGRLEGRLGVAKAKIWFTPGRTGSDDVQTTTNADGEYSVELVERGEYWVQFHLPSDSTAERSVEIGDEDEQVLDFRLPGTLLRGRVLDAEGNPHRAHLRLRRTDLESSTGGWSTVASDRASKDGSFVFEGLERGPWRMRVSASVPEGRPRTLATRFVSVDLASKDTLEDLVVRLEPGGAILGVVRGPDGKPVAGARVTARGEDGFDFDHETPAAERIATDAAGRYAIEGLARGAWQVRAVHGALASNESAVVRVEPDSRAVVDLALAPAGFLDVGLADARGDALRHGPGAWVRVLDASGRAWIDLEAERYGEWKRAHGPLPPGKWTVSRGDGSAFAPVEVELAPGERKSVTLRARE